MNRTAFRIDEGNCGQIPAQQALLRQMAKGKKKILEIGMNAGHSTEIFLEESTGLVVTFDLFQKTYSQDVEKQLADAWGNRIQFVKGDTRDTLPAFLANSKPEWDFVFIDGGHTFEVASSDLETVLQFAPRNCLLAMDDIVRETGHRWFSQAPSRVWGEAVEFQKIQELGQIDFADGRGMAWGKKI